MSNLFKLVEGYKMKGQEVKDQIVHLATTKSPDVGVQSFDTVGSIAVIFNLATKDSNGIEEATLAEVRTNTGKYPLAYVARYDEVGQLIGNYISFPDLDVNSKDILLSFLEEPDWIDEANLDENADPIFEILHQKLEEKLEPEEDI